MQKNHFSESIPSALAQFQVSGHKAVGMLLLSSVGPDLGQD